MGIYQRELLSCVLQKGCGSEPSSGGDQGSLEQLPLILLPQLFQLFGLQLLSSLPLIQKGQAVNPLLQHGDLSLWRGDGRHCYCPRSMPKGHKLSNMPLCPNG